MDRQRPKANEPVSFTTKPRPNRGEGCPPRIGGHRFERARWCSPIQLLGANIRDGEVQTEGCKCPGQKNASVDMIGMISANSFIDKLGPATMEEAKQQSPWRTTGRLAAQCVLSRWRRRSSKGRRKTGRRSATPDVGRR